QRSGGIGPGRDPSIQETPHEVLVAVVPRVLEGLEEAPGERDVRRAELELRWAARRQRPQGPQPAVHQAEIALLRGGGPVAQETSSRSRQRMPAARSRASRNVLETPGTGVTNA